MADRIDGQPFFLHIYQVLLDGFQILERLFLTFFHTYAPDKFLYRNSLIGIACRSDALESGGSAFLSGEVTPRMDADQIMGHAIIDSFHSCRDLGRSTLTWLR